MNKNHPLLLLFPYDVSENASEPFPKEVREEIKERSKIIKKTPNPCCMWFNCIKQSDHHKLETHHIVPRHLGGLSDENNAILLCEDHHHMATQLRLIPQFAKEMAMGNFSQDFEDLPKNKTSMLWEELREMRDYGDISDLEASNSRLKRIAAIRFAVADCHPKNTNRNAYYILGWSAVFMAEPYLCWIAGSTNDDRKIINRRKAIEPLLKDAVHYGGILKDPLLLAYAHHLWSVNCNAQQEPYGALDHAYEAEKKLHEVKNASLPIDLRRLEQYVFSQNAVIRAKNGIQRSLNIAMQGMAIANDLGANQIAESTCRLIHSALLLNDMRVIRKADGMLSALSNNLRTDKNILIKKTLAILALYRGDYPFCEAIANEAMKEAKASQRLHSAYKLGRLIEAVVEMKLMHRYWGSYMGQAPCEAQYLNKLL